MARLSISLLGPLRVSLGGEPVTEFATDKVRALLAYLAAEAAHSHRRDALAGLLWPDQPEERARQSLRQALSSLRQTLADSESEQPFLLTNRETIQFNPDCDCWVDVTAFRTLAEACRTHRHRRLATCLPCLQRMERMVELYRGVLLAQLSVPDSAVFEEWAALEREWLHRQALAALYHLTTYYQRRGELQRAEEYAWRQVALEPWREEAHRQLMLLLALSGRRSAALAQYAVCRRVLADELGVEPTAETTTLYAQIRSGEPLVVSSGQPARIPLSPTSFVGREQELAELADLLTDPNCRLLTLVGPGGIGKSRLALQAAAEQVGAFEHGVVFASLADVTSHDEMIALLLEVLEVPTQSAVLPREQLLNALRGKELLLVLDGLERVLTGSALLADILRGSPGVVLLATSREQLSLQEEWVYEVGGLPVPPADALDGACSYGAAELFQQRARQVNHRFVLTAAEMPAVARICRLAEGMPLGVELASAWVTVRSCAEIAREVESSLDLLATRLQNVPERHRSVRAAFEHSWQLLTEEERAALARLSVFRGGFHQQAAVAVAAASPAVILSLLKKSLLRQASADRYDMHSLLRQCAAEKLAVYPAEPGRTQAQHARYYASFLKQCEKDDRLLREVGAEIENVRQAWQTAVAGGLTDVLERGLHGLYGFYEVCCRFEEGIELFEQAVNGWDSVWGRGDVLGAVMARQGALYQQLGRYRQARACLEQSLALLGDAAAGDERIFCWVNLASVARGEGRYDEATRWARRALALATERANHWGAAFALFVLGLARYRAGDADRAQTLWEESLALARVDGRPRLIVLPLNGLGDIACHRGDYPKAQALFEECLALSREVEDAYNVALHLNNLGTVLHVLERYDEARELYRESLQICRDIGDRKGEAIALSNLGEVAYASGEHRRATVFYQQGLVIGRDMDDHWVIVACLNNLGEVYSALGDVGLAQTCLAEGLQLTADMQMLPGLLKVLTNVAALLARQGRASRAAALLALVRDHPASEQATRERAAALLDELGLAGAAAGDGSLDEFVTALLAELA